jgi:hypothetical protein
MKKTYYEKRGKRYVPVSEYDSDLLDSFSRGSHLVICYPGGVSRRYNVEPNYAALIAASRVAEDVMAKEIVKASEMRPHKKELTDGQRRAWNALADEFGQDLATLQISSAREIAEAGLKVLQDQAAELLENPSVKLAYEQFMMISALSKDNHNT